MQAEQDILDFIVIGAQKAGTTSLFEYLRGHPQIALPKVKEAPFFSHDREYERGWSRYMRILGQAGADRDAAAKGGTVTPHYMVGNVYQSTRGQAERNGYDERTVPARIAERLPAVKLVAILRDPVERARSHHQMVVRLGRERRSFDEAIEQLLRPDALEHSRRRPREGTGYIAWGEYGRILGGYLEVFPREQILVLSTAELEDDPAALLLRIYDFIGVRSDYQPENLGARYRVGAPERGFTWQNPATWMSPSSPISPQGVRRAFGRSSAAKAAWGALPEARQRELLYRYERLAHRSARRNRRHPPNEIRANAPPSPATLAALREHFQADGERLAALGIPPAWQTSPGSLLER